MKDLLKELLVHFPKMDRAEIEVAGALPKVSRYIMAVLGICLTTEQEMLLARSLKATSYQMHGYISDTKVGWISLALTVNGDITIVQVKGTEGYSATMFAQTDRYHPKLSMDIRTYSKGVKKSDRQSYVCQQSARFSPEDIWYKRASEVFLMLLANEASETHKFKQIVTVEAFRK